MKQLLTLIALPVLLAFPSRALGLTLPEKPQGYVSDYANILQPDQKNQLEQKLVQFEQQTSIETAIVTTPNLSNTTIEEYSVELFEKWGIGKKGKDNGLLIVVAPNERQTRIEVGYGLEPIITDAESSWIIRNLMLPEFKQNNYYQGINNAVDRLILVSTKQVPPQPPTVQMPQFNINVLIMILFGLQMVYGIMAATKSWWLGGLLGGIAGIIISAIYGLMMAGLLAFIVFIPLGFIIDYFASKWGIQHGVQQSRPWWHSGGGWGGGRGGGGFGGFGGGRSGGGGSSGRW